MRLRTPFLITLKRVVENGDAEFIARSAHYFWNEANFIVVGGGRGGAESGGDSPAPPRRSRGALCDRHGCGSVAVSIVETKTRIPRESAECKAVRQRHAETEKIETLGSSRMTKILEEIGAESGARRIKPGEGSYKACLAWIKRERERERAGGEEEENRFRILIKRPLRSMRTIYVYDRLRDTIWNIARISGRRDASYSGFILSMWPDKPTLNVDL